MLLSIEDYIAPLVLYVAKICLSLNLIPLTINLAISLQIICMSVVSLVFKTGEGFIIVSYVASIKSSLH